MRQVLTVVSFVIACSALVLSIANVAISSADRRQAKTSREADADVAEKREEAQKPKFHYLQEVAITGGFYRGHTAVIKHWYESNWYPTQYDVEITDFEEGDEKPNRGWPLRIPEDDLADWAVVNTQTKETLWKAKP